MDFWYDGQIRRYLLQVMRIFSVLSVRNGPDANGLYSIQQIPVMYGDPSSMVAQLIKGASENTVLPSPMFSVYIDSIKMNDKRRAAPQYVSKASIMERTFNDVTQTYGTTPGARQDIDRYMPVPYDITFKVDLWTTNTDTKLQIIEQVMMIFNPSLQLMQNSNTLDWTGIFELWLEDTTWTNRSVPQGGTDERDIFTFKFLLEGWINPPAKIKRSSLIAEIVTQVFADEVVSDIKTKNIYDPFSLYGPADIQIITTAGDYRISVARGINGDEVTLLNKYGQADPTLSWATLIQLYGQITPNITELTLKLDPNIEVDTSDVIGTIAQDPTRQNVLLFTPDTATLPGNTILPISAIIDPTEVYPGNGLPAAMAGQRYLLTSRDSAGEEPAIPPNVPTSPWGFNIVAYPNDIIEYNGVQWVVIFDSKTATGNSYVVNNSNSSQYTYDASTGQWSYTYYGQYAPGYWILDNLVSAPNGTTINQC